MYRTFMYVYYPLEYNIWTSSQWWNINYSRATCFGREAAIIRPMHNIYQVQYKCALYGIPYRWCTYVEF